MTALAVWPPQTVFIAVNFEEESGTAEADANDDDAMMRCGTVLGRLPLGCSRNAWRHIG